MNKLMCLHWNVLLKKNVFKKLFRGSNKWKNFRSLAWKRLLWTSLKKYVLHYIVAPEIKQPNNKFPYLTRRQSLCCFLTIYPERRRFFRHPLSPRGGRQQFVIATKWEGKREKVKQIHCFCKAPDMALINLTCLNEG